MVKKKVELLLEKFRLGSLKLKLPWKITIPLFFTLIGTGMAIEINSKKQNEIIDKNKSLIYDFKKEAAEELKLLPVPGKEIDVALSTVIKTRNPFDNIDSSIISNENILLNGIRFAGIAKTESGTIAMIENGYIQESYMQGELIGNGFYLKSISYEDQSIEISNGIKNIKLILK